MKHNYISLLCNSVIILPYYLAVNSCGILTERRSSVESEKGKVLFSGSVLYISDELCAVFKVPGLITAG